MFGPSSILFIIPAAVLAANDWSVPCHSGWCSYDSGDGIKAAFGALTINGPVNSISDITKASGWHILECDPSSKEPQTIRMVCVGEDEDAAGCSHIDIGGADNTIIRLPESCGGGPFARVDRKWIHEDQTIPDSVVKKLNRRANAPAPLVKAVKFDFDFAKIPAGTKGPVGLSASATNIPGQEQTLGNRALAGAFHKRRSADGRPLHRRNFITDIINKLKNLNKFDKSFRDKLPPVNLKKNFPLFETSLNCPAKDKVPAIDAHLKIDVDTDLNAVVTFGYAVTGTIVPPKIDDLALYSALNADASAVFNIDASAHATIDSGVKDLFSVGLPGLDFPGIFTLGPSFAVAGQVKASLGATGNMKVGATFTMPQVELVFPPKQGSSKGDAGPKPSPLKLNLNPSGSVAGSVEAHLIPRVDLGATILGGIGKATVFLNMDVFGKVEMGVKGQAAVTTSSDPTKSLSGCIDMDIGVDINAGAQADLKPFFDKSTSVKLFSKDAKLLHKCFGGAKREIAIPPTLVRRAGLTCPGIQGALTNVIDSVLNVL